MLSPFPCARCPRELLGIASDTLPAAVRAAQQLALALSPLASPEAREVGALALSELDAALAVAHGGPLLEALRSATEAAPLPDTGQAARLRDVATAVRSRAMRPGPRWRRDAPKAAELRANAIGLLVRRGARRDGRLHRQCAPSRSAAESASHKDMPFDALDAVLQRDPPVQNTRRWAAQDPWCCRARPSRPARSCCCCSAATRCPHLAFGDGAHACPGAALARTLAQVALAQLLAVGLEPAALAGRFCYRRSLNGRIPLFTGASGCAMIAVIFEVHPAPGQRQAYLDTAAALRPLLEGIDGFLSIERFESLATPGKLLSLSFWRDEEAVAHWRNTEAHRAAQVRGRTEVFADYRLRVAAWSRDYGLGPREGAPPDSRARHG